MIDKRAVLVWVYASFCFAWWTVRYSKDRGVLASIVLVVGAMAWPLWPVFFLLKKTRWPR